MKKNSVIVLLIASIAWSQAFAQGRSASAQSLNAVGSSQPHIIAADPVFKNAISIKALRAFAREFKEVEDARWHKGDDWFAAYFTRDDIQFKVFYDCYGNHRYTMRSYHEPDLPKEVRHIVKSTHYDYNIYHINEITTRGVVIYFIKLEGKNSWMDVKIVDNEMATVQEYTKAK